MECQSSYQSHFYTFAFCVERISVWNRIKFRIIQREKKVLLEKRLFHFQTELPFQRNVTKGHI